MNEKKTSVRDMCLIGFFAAIMAICAQISIPMPYGVPMTLQTFAIPLAGVVLGAKRGTIATMLYVLLGAVGVPVFSGFMGGLSRVLGPTGGFILSFPIMAFCAGIGARYRQSLATYKKTLVLITSLVVGTSLNYMCGMVFFSLVTSNNLLLAFTYCVLPFIPVDTIKMALVVVLGRNVKGVLVKSGMM